MVIRFLKLNPDAETPRYMSEGAAGCDVMACLRAPLEVPPGERVAITTGLAFEIPEGFEVQVRPRSGLSFKQGLTVINAPGTIDSDYRGEVKILMVNLGISPVTVSPGDRIAQLVLNRVERIQWQSSLELSQSDRDGGGFGSTGK